VRRGGRGQVFGQLAFRVDGPIFRAHRIGVER
jgi:hypothetical protein